MSIANEPDNFLIHSGCLFFNANRDKQSRWEVGIDVYTKHTDAEKEIEQLARPSPKLRELLEEAGVTTRCEEKPCPHLLGSFNGSLSELMEKLWPIGQQHSQEELCEEWADGFVEKSG